MAKIKIFVVSIVLMTSVVLAACGGTRRVSFEEMSNSKNPGLKAEEDPFRFWILNGSQRDPRLPSSTLGYAFTTETQEREEESLGVPVTVKEDLTIIPQTISLSSSEKSKGLFLAWPAKLFGSTIVETHFEHHIQNPLNQSEGSVDRSSASWDEQHQRWYISLSEFFQNHETELNPADVHWFSFDFLLKDNGRKFLQVGLKLMGPPPKIQPKLIELKPIADANRFVQSLRSGWSIREQLTNPTQRMLALWVRLGQERNVRIRTELVVPRFVENKSEEPSGPNYEHYESFASLRFDGLKVTKGSEVRADLQWTESSGVQNSSQNSMSSWVRIEMQPAETFIFEWKANPQASHLRCSIPEPEIHSFRWSKLSCLLDINPFTRLKCLAGGPYLKLAIYSKEIKETWSVASVQFQGVLEREIRVTDFSRDSIEEENIDLTQVSLFEKIPVKLQVGESPHKATSFACQGLF